MYLTEFEPGRAVIEPNHPSISYEIFETCDTIILPFSGEIVDRVSQLPTARIGGYLASINGRSPWYILDEGDSTVAVTLAPLGAPFTVGKLEELRAIGFEHFVILGSCGVLDKSLAADKIIVPTAGLRDEGTSFHYAPPSREIAYVPELIEELKTILSSSAIPHTTAKTWTTDAFYRETPAKVARRLADGAQVVDMEATAIMAWSQFRGTKVYQFFYTADYVPAAAGDWDKRVDERQADVLRFFEVALAVAKGVGK